MKKSDKSSIKSIPSLLAALCGVVCINVSIAAEQVYSITSQPVATALDALSKKSGVQFLVFSDQLQGKTSNVVRNAASVEEALEIMLAGQGLRYEFTDENTVAIKSVSASAKKPGEGTAIDSGSRAVIEEIIVTAQKREQRLIDVPMSVYAKTGEELNSSGVTDLLSLSLAVPGLSIQENGSFLRRIFIRGVGNLAGNSPLIGLYLDEASVTATSFDQIDLRVYDIERIEVLKGPQGTLYGEGSVGGTIRYITNDPLLDRFEGTVSADLSVTKDGDASRELRSVINVPLTEDSLALRVAGQYIDMGGWIDQPALGLSDINDYELFNIRSKLLWRPSDSLEMEGTVIVHRNDGGAQNVGEDENGDYHQFLDDSTPSTKDDYNFYSLLVDYDLGGLSLISSTSYLDSTDKFKNGGYQCCFHIGTSDDFFKVFVPVQDRSTEVITQEFRVSTNGGGPLNETLGIFYRELTDISNTPSTFFGVPGGTLGVDILEFGLFFRENHSRSWSVFGEVSYQVNDDLELGAGLRYFEDKRRLRDAPSASFQQEEDFDSLNPRFFISYKMNESARVYFNLAKGFRSGGFNATGVPPYDPESLWSSELGTKLSTLDGRLDAELALFYSTYDEYQIIGLDPDNIGAGDITTNQGEVKIKGIDASVSLSLSDNFNLGLVGNYTEAEFTEIKLLSGSHGVGDTPDFIPEYSFSLWGDYSFLWADEQLGFVRLDYSRQGRSEFRNYSFGSDYFSYSGVIDTLNARIGWEYQNWSAEVYATNLLNDRDYIDAWSIQLLASRPRPRTVGISIGTRF